MPRSDKKRIGDAMSKHNPPTMLSVIIWALRNQKRMARLQSLLITITYCIVVVTAIPAAVITLSGGNVMLSAGLRAVPAVLGVSKAWKHFRRSVPTRGKP